MQVQLLRTRQITENGRVVTRHKGDFVNVPRLTAIQWINKGVARLPGGDVDKLTTDDLRGVTLLVVNGDGVQDSIDKLLPEAVMIEFGGVEDLPGALERSERGVVFWSQSLSGVTPDMAQIQQGLAALDKFDVAYPVHFSLLAEKIGTKAARTKTEDAIGEMRVPVPEPGLLFIRKSEAGQALAEAWLDELGEDAPKLSANDTRLAFMRALWHVKPTNAPMPENWVELK